jgi:hypothetical protein
MNHATYNMIVGFIWNIADDVLRDVYVREISGCYSANDGDSAVRLPAGTNQGRSR